MIQLETSYWHFHRGIIKGCMVMVLLDYVWDRMIVLSSLFKIPCFFYISYPTWNLSNILIFNIKVYVQCSIWVCVCRVVWYAHLKEWNYCWRVYNLTIKALVELWGSVCDCPEIEWPKSIFDTLTNKVSFWVTYQHFS